MTTAYKFLEPYTFKNGMTVKNRVVIPPMTEASSFEEGSITTDELRYFRIHSGGVGMFISPVANVSESGKGFEGQLSITDDRFLPGLTKMASAMKQGGAKAILQIFHAGRMSNSKVLRGTQAVSASAVAAERPNAETPRELTNPEIEQIIDDFGEATRRAIQAGFDGIELHGANTYLLQQFFSPHSNRRTDKWGGNVQKRMTFALEVIKRVHSVVTQYAKEPFIVGYRISPEEIETPGIRLADTMQFIDVLADQPIDYLHISMGYVWRTSLNDETDTEPIILKIKRQIHNRLPLISVGSVEQPADAEKVLDAGIDFVAIGRELLREPNWVQKVESNDEESIRYTISIQDLDELGITPAMWNFLTVRLKSAMHISNQPDYDKGQFDHRLAPHEGA
ncbi:NADH-dependent flavin oxidoreductase [Oenococcus oeni]|uniref:NADH:flavin oxydoreductase, Old Yellow Enzyme family n=4 Tax=Oenococcus oeni TaxID=1247 RepID=K7X783_OENOE|nr:NADH-dependent flavin oxidoreductase [Oenococcus oeni]KGO17062.1 NADH-dependent flavin oxidoreductase [Oenococcus oeni X2L]AFX65497.1 NADH:flavin oxydoreductase, Old Yellow Enzyme family [Oenococcus oeni]EJN98956.1 NADH:flavin oxidoreductase [Oenococcus oeni AWRIB419]EJO04663.1 NADH:flavin oxidoreductase [Oenococcus oeni AWRIB422]KDE87244.1 NADH-dependent flavin oxidoreductase [Oenococcus oeni]